MRRALAASVLVTLLAPLAFARTAAGQPVRTVPTQPEIAAQVTFDTSYLLALYMAQLATAGTPPSQADIDEATRQYLTNGAAVTSVPTSGPGAAYFHNGAEVMAFRTQSVAPAPEPTVSAGAGSLESEPYPYEVDSGVSPVPSSGGEAAPAGTSAPPLASASEIRAGSEVRAGSTGPTCGPLELEAAMAIAGQFATAVSPPQPATECPRTNASTPVPQRAESAPDAVVEPALQCPAGPSAPSRIPPALGGALLGALAVTLWSRSRPVRAMRTRDAR